MMKVKELVKILNKYDPEMEVILEYDDSYHKCEHVDLFTPEKDECVLLQ